MKLQVRFCLSIACAAALLTASAPSAEAGLFAKLFKKHACCEPAPEPECGCEPSAEPEPVCCEAEPEPVCCEPEPEPVCCEPAPEPEPVCCEPEPAPEPECCTPEPVECCAANSLPKLAEGEVLIAISPLPQPVAAEIWQRGVASQLIASRSALAVAQIK